MKKFISFSLLCLLAVVMAFGQTDSRNRTVTTIISDGLAQLPAQNSADYLQVIPEMAATGEEGIVMLAERMGPAATTKNATFEYAINSIVSYASEEGNEQLLPGIHAGLVKSLQACKDVQNRVFLLSQIQKIATPADAALFESLLADAEMQDHALAALCTTLGIDDILARIIKEEKAPRAKLAYLAYCHQLKAAEPQLLAWVNGADEATLAAIYNAMTVCGTAPSLAALQKAAKKAGFKPEPTGALEAYLQLLDVYPDNAVVAKAATALTKQKLSAVRCAGLRLLMKSDWANTAKIAAQALTDADIQYRNTALDFALEYAGPSACKAIAAKYPSLPDVAKVDVIRFWGKNHCEANIHQVTAAIDAQDETLANAAIKAAGQIGGQKALEALVAALGKDEKKAKAAEETLLTFNGKVNPGVIAALDSKDAAVQTAALRLASTRRMYAAYDKVMALTATSNEACKALSGVARPQNFDAVCELMDKASAEKAALLQDAAKNAIQSLPAAEQYKLTEARMAKAPNAALYYPLLAQAGTSEAIAKLLAEQKNGKSKDAAMAAMLQVNNKEMIPHLFDLAKNNPNDADKILKRNLTLIKGAGLNAVELYQHYEKALHQYKLTDDTAKSYLTALQSAKIGPALALAAAYLDADALKMTAAETVKEIAAGNNALQQGNYVKDVLNKAKTIFAAEKQNGNADAGYAIDKIDLMLGDWAEGEGFAPVKAITEKDKKGTLHAVELPSENFEFWFQGLPVGATLTANGTTLVERTDKGLVILPQQANAETKTDVAEDALLMVKKVDDRLFVEANGSTVCQNAIIERLPDMSSATIVVRSEAAPAATYATVLKSTPVYRLSDEEKAQGFELLFDGRSLENFHGNTAGYVPQDGCIYVTAHYGGTGNLYTKKNYSDFVFRFEFWFDVPAVNNGIGIRTGRDVTGVDAAYYGMEIQVLDHDDPVYQGHPFGYKGLRPYQNHGSVYGIVVPEHIDFGPIKQWHTEEIRAVGDRITVTVDGKVVTDANIRDACQGHNVSPDGGANPYTLDHQNHPGLFNKEGYISFCGHGPGVKFRNVRVLDLSKKGAKK